MNTDWSGLCIKTSLEERSELLLKITASDLESSQLGSAEERIVLEGLQSEKSLSEFSKLQTHNIRLVRRKGGISVNDRNIYLMGELRPPSGSQNCIQCCPSAF